MENLEQPKIDVADKLNESEITLINQDINSFKGNLFRI